MDVDVDVEMVDQGRCRAENDGIVATEDFDEFSGRPHVKRQNNCFVVCLAAFTLSMAVFVVGTVYLSPDELPANAFEFSPESGTVGKDQQNKIKEAFATVQTSNDKNAGIAAWMKENGFTNTTGNIAPHPHKSGSNAGKHHSAIIAGDQTHVTGHANDPAGGAAQTSAPPQSPAASTISEDVQAWLATEVTISDGVKYEIVDQLTHDTKAFTEGLAYANGMLYESTGLNDKSTIRTLDPLTGEVIDSYPVSGRYFGEGLVFVNDKLIQLTWKSKTGFVYDASDLTIPPQHFNFTSTRNQGWGITYDAERGELIESDGTSYLHFWDPDLTKFQQLRRIQVIRQNGFPAKQMNELEYWRGRVLANVWHEDTILVINPETGIVEKEYDFSQLWPLSERKKVHADVLNGISISEDPDILYVTGKDWDRMFRVRLLF